MGDPPTTSAPVLAAEDLRYQAMIDADLSTIDRLLAEELSYAHSSGVRDTKAEYLEKVRTGYYVYHRSTTRWNASRLPATRRSSPAGWPPT